MGCCQRDAGL